MGTIQEVRNNLDMIRHIASDHFYYNQILNRNKIHDILGFDLEDDDHDRALIILVEWIADHGLEYALSQRPPQYVWTLGWSDEEDLFDSLTVIKVFSTLEKAIEYCDISADLEISKKYKTSPVEFRVEGHAVGTGKFLIVIREEKVDDNS